MTIAHPAAFRTVDGITFQGLFLPGKQRDYMTYTIVGGQSLPIGSVLGLVTATNKLQLCKAAAGDGSQNPYAILPETVNTYAADGVTPLDMSLAVVVAGYVNLNALVLDSSLTLTTVANQLRALGIFSDVPNYSG